MKMKNLVLVLFMLSACFGCSRDDGPESNCASCTAEGGVEIEVCDNGDGTIDISQDGVTITITEEELGDLTIEQLAQSGCAD